MNIFAVGPDPVQCAQALDNRRLVKMVLETAQMLSTALRPRDPLNPVYYKATHANHPCTRWVMADPAHLSWTIALFFAYSNEYTHRFGKTHASDLKLGDSFRNHYEKSDPPREWCNCTPFPDAPPFDAYRLTLIAKWRQDAPPPKWTNRPLPEWYLKDIPS